MKAMVLKPKRLKKGQAIGIVAPAGPVTPPEIQPGIGLLESWGYKVITSPHLYDRQGYMAGDDNARLEDLYLMFNNGGVKAILCARGGYGTLRLLERVNFDLIRKHPKIIMGYSDITALLMAIYTGTGLVAFHGTVVKELAKNRNRNLKSFIDLVSSERFSGLDLNKGMALIPGRAEGILLGGNLSLICHLVGTPFMPSLKKAILFIEDRGEPLYRIDRMLTHLRLSGLLADLSGLIAGTFKGCGDSSSVNQILVDTFSDLNVPLVSGLPVGHGQDNLCLPLGIRAVLDTERMRLAFKESCVST